MKKNQDPLFEKAQEKLSLANKELFKPEEDVVSYMVCKNSQIAIEAYLKGYLSHRGFESHEKEHLEGLLIRCKELDNRFNNIDLNVIDCKTSNFENNYCSEVNKVSSCFDVADSIDTLLKRLKVI